MSAYVIIANGDFLEKNLIQQICLHKIIIALDGAAQKLWALDLKPHIILGDFDSLDTITQAFWGITKIFAELHNHDKPYLGNDGIMIVPSLDQSLTDLVKAIHYCDANDVSEISIICALGGRIDHDEANKRALRMEYNPSRPLTLYTATQLIRFVRNASVQIVGRVGDNIGILGFPNARFSSNGLQYEGDNTLLDFGYDSACNALKLSEAMITIEGDALLILPSPYRI
jgi:thiamine pyrophosphokinase